MPDLPQLQTPDVLGAYLRGRMAPLQIQAAQQENTFRGLQADQLRMMMDRQRSMNNYIDQLVTQQRNGAQNAPNATGGIQNGPQASVTGPTQSSGSYDGSIGGFEPTTLTALALLRGDDPLKTAEGIQSYQMKQRQMQAQGPMSLAETVSSSPNADVIIKNNPSLQQAWIKTAPQLGLDPFKDLTPENARKAAIFNYNALAGSAGLPPKPMPVQMENKGIQQINPLTGKIEHEEELQQVVGPNGQPTLVPRSKAVGMTPFNQSIFGASNLSDQAKEFAYQNFVATGKVPSNYGRNPAMQASLMDYIAKRAEQEGNSAAALAAKGQAFTASQGVVKDFTSGPTSKILNALNTAIKHSEVFEPLIDTLGNTNIQFVNKIKNAIETQFGGTAPTTFDAVKSFVAGEVSKTVLPGGGGEREREEISTQVKNASTPDQLKSVVANWKELLAGKTSALRNQWDVGTMGTQGSFDKFLLPETKKALGINSPASNSAPPAAIAYLKAHPEVKEQFKAKYGYLPDGQ